MDHATTQTFVQSLSKLRLQIDQSISRLTKAIDSSAAVNTKLQETTQELHKAANNIQTSANWLAWALVTVSFAQFVLAGVIAFR